MGIAQHILDNLPDMVMLADQNNYLLYANPPACKYFHLPSRDGFFLEPYLQISPVETSWDEFWQRLQEQRHLKSLFVRYSEQGEQFLEIDFSILDEGHVLSLSREITSQKKQEARWARQKMKEEALASLIPDASFLVACNYTLLDFNSVAEQWFATYLGRTLKKGDDIRDLQIQDLAVYLAAFERARQGEKSHLTQRVRQGNSLDQTVNLAFAPVYNESQEIWAVMILTQDVSPLKALQENVQTFRQRLQNFSRVLPGCLYEYDVNTRTEKHWFSYLSEEASTLLGFTSEQVVGSPGDVMQHIPEAERERLHHGILRAARQQKMWEAVFAYQHPTAGLRWVFGRSRPQVQGDHVLFSGVLLDVTDAEQARRELHEQQRQNQAILTAMPDAIFQVFTDGRLVDVKPGNHLQRLAFEGDTLAESNLPENLKLYLKQGIEDALCTGETHHLEFDYTTATGEQIYYEIRLIASGEDSVFCVVRNITEFISLNHQFQESQQTLLAMLENSGNDSIWYVNPQLELIMANQACLRNTPRWNGRFLSRGDNVLDFMARGDLEEATIWKFHYKEALSGQRTRREYHYTRDNGETVYLECFFNPVFSQGQVMGCVCLARDITYFKSAETRLKQMNIELEQRVEERTAQLRLSKEQAETANFAKTGFLANISHEVRTPIHAVLGYSEMIEMVLKKEVDRAEIQDYARSIRKSAQTLLLLINDLLDLSQLESGAMATHPETMDLKGLCGDVITMFRPRAYQKKLELQLMVADNVPRFIESDPVRCRQILMNLLGNAVKFTQEGYVCLRVSADEQFVQFAVEDSGIGIRPSSLASIFDPFVQQEGQLTRDYGGTGLGLSITQRLVTLMGGSIEVESEPDRGSCFCVRLPLVFVKDHDMTPLPAQETPPTEVVPVEDNVLLTSQLSAAQLKSLEKTFESDYLQTLKSYSFDRTSAFARRLHSWAMVYEFQPLIDLSHDLLNAVGRFDIEKMTSLLSYYAHWIETMKEYYE